MATNSFSDNLFLAAAFTGAVLLACFLGGGFWCGLFLFARLAETLFRRLPWQPSMGMYGLGIVCCLPCYAANYAGGKGAALVQLGVRHLHPALPARLNSWLGFVFFVLPLLCNWVAWALYRLENPALKSAPAASYHPLSEAVWPPPPADLRTPEEPNEVAEKRTVEDSAWRI